MKAIPYGKQSITEDDIAAVVEALQADYLTQGPRIAAFEKSFAHYVDAKFAIAVANGTAALHLCALALNVKPGQKVITTPITFAASANCISYCGGEVVLADIDPETYLLDLEKVRALLEESPKGTYAGIVPVDFAGRAINMQAFRDLADEYNLWIIEDSCHAPGGFFVDDAGQEQKCGNGQFADLSIFSFHPVKHIASGEGGMITTNNPALYERLLELRTHGITRAEHKFENTPDLATGIAGASSYPGWYMEMQDLGYNYRLTDFQSALGMSQLKSANKGLAKRKQLAAVYEEAFKNEDFIIGQSGIVKGHAYHLYVVEVKDRLGLYNFLRTKNVFTQVHYIPVHYMPFYQQKGYQPGNFPHAENYYKHCLSLPMFPTLTADEQAYVIAQIKAYYHG